MELKLPPLAENGETLTGAEIVVRCLKEEGVEFVFGYPGGAVLHIYDAIFNQQAFNHILVRHEQAALHASALRRGAAPEAEQPPWRVARMRSTAAWGLIISSRSCQGP